MNEQKKTRIQYICKLIKVSFPYTIPILTGFLVLGLAYGILMQSKGYGPLWSGLFCGIAFCGSMQFVAVAILTTAFDPLQALLLSFMVNVRHVFYGLSFLEKYRGLGWRKFFCIYTLCDESFSVLSTIEPPEEIKPNDFYFTVSFLIWIYWMIGGFLGGLIGTLVHFNTKGLDFALTALFVVLLLEQLEKKENRIPICIGIIVPLLCVFVFGAEYFVIPAMVVLIICLLIGRKRLCD